MVSSHCCCSTSGWQPSSVVCHKVKLHACTLQYIEHPCTLTCLQEHKNITCMHLLIDQNHMPRLNLPCCMLATLRHNARTADKPTMRLHDRLIAKVLYAMQLNVAAALLLCRAVTGLGEAIAPSAIIDMIARTVPANERASAVSTAFAGLHFGSIIGLLASPVIINSYGWKSLFYIFGAAGRRSMHSSLPRSHHCAIITAVYCIISTQGHLASLLSTPRWTCSVVLLGIQHHVCCIFSATST